MSSVFTLKRISITYWPASLFAKDFVTWFRVSSHPGSAAVSFNSLALQSAYLDCNNLHSASISEILARSVITATVLLNYNMQYLLVLFILYQPNFKAHHFKNLLLYSLVTLSLCLTRPQNLYQDQQNCFYSPSQINLTHTTKHTRTGENALCQLPRYSHPTCLHAVFTAFTAFAELPFLSMS